MALFGSNSDESSSTSSQDAASSRDAAQAKVNLVAEGTVFEGTLTAENDVRTSGRVQGTLDVQGKAVVAKSGVVEGEIQATKASIAGQVRGDIVVEERLVLRETARVDGNIQAGRLVIEEGAVFVGECSMEGSQPDFSSSSDGLAAQEKPMPKVRPSSDTQQEDDQKGTSLNTEGASSEEEREMPPAPAESH